MEIHPLAPDKRAAVLDALDGIERIHDVRILLACESGSRSWGFSSPDSDYDARFVYVHRPKWYLTVNERTGPGEPQRDVIELPIDADLDVSGWDLRKALRLVSKSNPTLLEWLQSPLVYRQDPVAVAGLLQMAHAFYSPLGTWWHYFNMAKSNYRGYLRGERIRTKKYLYVLRPVLACQWIERGHGMPPMAFELLLEALLPSGSLREAIDALLEKKRAAAEIEDGPRVPAISDFLDAELARMGGAAPRLAAGSGDPRALDALFRQLIRADASA
ncbi:nucleotidyltransferase domain-containing protein [Xanthomonas sp. NCPPB 2654]|uniref:nucleotidyltransferase domain-containing protein n=1 Tax=unclassified Xanthomonas TaxID=2643310 RepID=UPI0021DFCD74|nr:MULTISPECIES: nucleotidyltransferase domain-containing protein [unclassified Xanthomonas]MDL5364348.1 nucleotidyltransferase domain-containing protein [Xanthomonas sp. NCPPB 2654]UYC20357.1 nucleotidyltransferase domain-containing protein [Xanthomonas sp. CFBP 8443]